MTDSQTTYRVLARKYRPATFAELIGQEAMVRTLTNAIATGRIAHAFILTGVRGVGKTTTARILARALNCVGPDGKGGPTVTPCGQCEPCRAIAEDRHVDILEMDAASRTGVEDIRDLTDGVRYKPVAARSKIYIIDEVHMLSKAAFNALLKTLEEPPPDVKFIFATTEIQKVPVTVLSRCQRFSLRRVPAELLEAHYAKILDAEKVAAEPAAVTLVARAADGSVRDGLSLLDQAIALSAGGAVTESSVRDMLGIADKGLVFDLLETVLRGDAAGALGRLGALYDGGADPVLVVQDLLDLVHFLMRLKLTPNAGEGDPAMEGERGRGQPLAAKLSVPVLVRSWQMLLKGLAETQTAPSPLQAAEMVLVRLAYVADLPAPADLVKALSGPGAAPPASGVRPPSGMSTGTAAPTMLGGGAGAPSVRRTAVGETEPAGAPHMARSPEPTTAPAPGLEPMPQSFLEVVALFDRKREALLRSHLFANVHLVRFEVGRIELRPTEGAPRDLANRLGKLLGDWTGERWVVSISHNEGEPTLREQAAARDETLRHEAAAHPLVRAVLDAFPGARIEAVRDMRPDVPPPADPEPPTDDADEGEP
ncbi:MAG TPA: DNA polymerase III subunit gamma/tau [Stellaceae bacterium]|nr:DNA polymerase III subunit gamma/tau [Stellaceae bacterium]